LKTWAALLVFVTGLWLWQRFTRTEWSETDRERYIRRHREQVEKDLAAIW
jgi:hypothetical protein